MGKSPSLPRLNESLNGVCIDSSRGEFDGSRFQHSMWIRAKYGWSDRIESARYAPPNYLTMPLLTRRGQLASLVAHLSPSVAESSATCSLNRTVETQ